MTVQRQTETAWEAGDAGSVEPIPYGRPGLHVAPRSTTSAEPSPLPRKGAGATRPYAAVIMIGSLIVTAAILVALWTALAARQPAYILPGPHAVWDRFVSTWRDGSYLQALGVTSEEAILGWLAGVAIGIPLGYVLGQWNRIESTIGPYLAASQAMPVVAIAPLLVVWLGFGLTPKVAIAALVCFFPVVTTTAGGLRGVERDLRDVARVFGASRWQMLRYLELPLAARSIFSGLKVAAALSVTGAIVGEFVSADQGLGFLIQLGRTNFDTALIFVALVSLMAMGALAFGLIRLLEGVAGRWME